MTLALAWRILRHPHVRGSAVAIGLSLVPLVVILIVADGMIQGITQRYLELKTYHLRAYLPDGSDPSSVAAGLEGTRGVVGAYAEIDGEGLVRAGSRSVAVYLRGIDPRTATDPGFARYLRIVDGVFDLTEPGTAMIGVRTAQTLGVGVGDVLGLATLSGRAGLTAPRLGRIRIVGVFSTGYQELDRNWVLLSVREAGTVLARDRRETFVGIKIADPFGDRRALSFAVRSRLPAGSRLYDWYDLERNQFSSFEITRNLLAFIMGLIVVVGCVNVSSAVIMVVLERQRDIGILAAMGATPSWLRGVFLAVGLGVGIAGSLGGIALGLLVGVNVNELFALVDGVVNAARSALDWAQGVRTSAPAFSILGSGYYLERIPVQVGVRELYLAAFVATGLSGAFAWLSARRVSRLEPVVAIQR